MKNLPGGEFKTHLSEVLKKAQQGESFGITYGKSKRLVAEINPPKKKTTKKKRKIGIMDGKLEGVCG